MIDEKLREIVDKEGYDTRRGTGISNKGIAQIKQAFAEEGYVQIRDELVPPNQPPVMTGKYWYERFRVEYDRLPHDNQTKDQGKYYAVEAAKKAAGL